MRRSSYFILTMFLTGTLYVACKKDNSPTTTPTSTVNLKKGLMVYLPFDGNFADSSGNNNVTTAKNGAALTADEHGNLNSAFNGTAHGEKIVVTNNGSITFDTAITISSNVMLRDLGPNDFISMLDNSSSKGFVWGMGILPTAPTFTYSFADSLSDCSSYSLANAISSDTTYFTPQSESWYNIITVFHKGTLSLYVNGKLISTHYAKSTYVPMNSCATLNIGGWWDGDPGASLNGKLDEVRIYNRILNSDEIAELSKNFQN